MNDMEDGRERRFLDYSFPECFEIFAWDPQDREWICDRRCHISEVCRLDDGTYLHQAGGSPLFLRITSTRGGVLRILDGGGKPWRCIVLATDEDPRKEGLRA